MKQLVYFSRIFVGSLFVISGMIKANDPLGFSYKLGEYFEESALGLPFLEDYALGLAMLACLAEVVLGFAVIFGGKMKVATAALVILTVFFGWLTFYTATCDPAGVYTVMVDGAEVERGVTCVTDCGCFGDAMKGSIGRSLTPWESFQKDAVLFIFIIPITLLAFGRGIKLNTASQDKFLLPLSLLAIAFFSWVFTWYFPVLFSIIVMALYLLIKRVKANSDWLVAGMVAVVTVGFMWYCISSLPLRDYRPYAVGQNLVEQMKSAEELGLEPPVFMYNYTMVNETSKEQKVVTSKEYLDDKWWQREGWTQDKTKTEGPFKVSDGYEPPIPDLSFQTSEGDEGNYLILENEQPVLVIITYDVKHAEQNMDAVSKLAIAAEQAGMAVYGLSASGSEDIDSFRHEHQLAFPYMQGDEKVLKTIVRSNPGVVLLNGATVKGKWAAGHVPSLAELQASL